MVIWKYFYILQSNKNNSNDKSYYVLVAKCSLRIILFLIVPPWDVLTLVFLSCRWGSEKWGHTAKKWQSQDLNPNSSDSKACVLSNDDWDIHDIGWLKVTGRYLYY